MRIRPGHAILLVLLTVAAACGGDGSRLTSPSEFAAPRLAHSLTANGVIISQVYGGGGNSGATYTNDFIELYNASDNAVSLSGWSVQYASSAGITWQTTALSGTIQPGKFYLVQQAAGSGGTTALPAPDATGAIAMSATAGKIALVSSTTALTGSCPTGAPVVDLVGYGTANCFEGSGAAAATANTTAAVRKEAGEQDTNNNANDFVVVAPKPRNTASIFVVASVVVTPATPIVQVGETQQFVARAFDALNAQIAGVKYTWTSATTATATVNSAGLATAVANGTSLITATAPNAVAGSATLTVGGAGPAAACHPLHRTALRQRGHGCQRTHRNRGPGRSGPHGLARRAVQR